MDTVVEYRWQDIEGGASEEERRRSLSRELGRCRRRLRISQLQLSRLLNMKLHRLSDLEKARSLPTAVEEQRVRRRLQEMLLGAGDAEMVVFPCVFGE